ncbi:MAG: CRISPR-associated helicase Cas3' [Gemmatimonadaceae bacterium]|nr:CRISPR-associated helicase Cas3' [Gemmatimonadaceae bacterium]
MSMPDVLSFWGKAANGPDGQIVAHPVACHLLDVAAVADAMLIARPGSLRRVCGLLGLENEETRGLVVALVALHDLGKFAPAFQGKVPTLWPDALGAFSGQAPPGFHTDDGWVLWESELGTWFKNRVWPDAGGVLDVLAPAVFGHHGRPPKESRATASQRFGRGKAAVMTCAELVLSVLLVPRIHRAPPDPEAVRVASWWLAGFVSTADWIGSGASFNVDWFERSRGLRNDTTLVSYWREARARAERAVFNAGVASTEAAAELPFSTLSDKDRTPTALQKWAIDLRLPPGPLLFILEDVTGSGKTEAAHVLVHKLMSGGRATGAYWAMPTQATANAMYERQASSIARLYAPSPKRPSLVLAHGQQRLHEVFRSTVLGHDLERPEPATNIAVTDGIDELPGDIACAAFLANDARAGFLADLGAGTVDQAILGVLPSRYNAMRLFGLCEKVLVIDEAHAYDRYVLGEVKELLSFHAALGGSAIVLSATLTRRVREEMETAWREGIAASGASIQLNAALPSQSGGFGDAYPLVTVINPGVTETIPIPAVSWATRTVPVRLVYEEDEIVQHIEVASRQGACVAWIRNSVGDCIESAERLRGHGLLPIVFHARFAQVDRQRIEQSVIGWFGVKSTPDDRRGRVIVATQVIEQSLDLDFDVVVSDIAPADLLIQRLGRLQRHERDRPADLRREFVIFSPPADENPEAGWLSGPFKRTSFVYENAGVLWKGIRKLHSNPEIAVPGGVRAIVEDAYGPGPIPEPLEAACLRATGRASAAASTAKYATLKVTNGYCLDQAWWSDLHLRTRLGEESTTLRIGRVSDSGEIVPWADDEQPASRAWALSEVRVFSYRVPIGSSEVSSFRSAVARAKRDWSEYDRELPLLPLVSAGEGVWEGSLVRPNDRPIAFRYTLQDGLVMETSAT